MTLEHSVDDMMQQGTLAYAMDRAATREWLHRMIDEACADGSQVEVGLEIAEEMTPRVMRLRLTWRDQTEHGG